MRKSHPKVSGIAAAALGLLAATPSPALAIPKEVGEDVQPAEPSTSTEPELSAQQQGEVSNWPEDKQVAYENWPAETKSYYWSLKSSRQAMFWRLTDEQKIALTAMTGPERNAAWQQIEGRSGSSG